MKRISMILIVLLVCLAVCSACGPQEVQQPYEQRTEVKIGALKGPTGIGLAGLMEQNTQKQTENRYRFELFSDPTEIVPLISNGDLDIAAVPTNLAATLYNKTGGKVRLLALNTLGVLYVLQKGEQTVFSVADLAGKTVFMSGQGATPEYAFSYILAQNGITGDQAPKIEFVQDHSALAAQVIAGEAEIAVLPEPFVSTVLGKDPEVHNVLDLNAAWDQACEEKSLFSMGCMVVREDFLSRNTGAVLAFLREYAASVAVMTGDIAPAAELAVRYGILGSAELAQKAIPNCKIVLITGEEMAEKTKPYLEILYGFNPKAVGGALPDESFYYTGK